MCRAKKNLGHSEDSPQTGQVWDDPSTAPKQLIYFWFLPEISTGKYTVFYIRVIPNTPEYSASRLFRIRIFGQSAYSIRDSNIILFVNYLAIFSRIRHLGGMFGQCELGFVDVVLLNLTNWLCKLDWAALGALEARKNQLGTTRDVGSWTFLTCRWVCWRGGLRKHIHVHLTTTDPSNEISILRKI